MPDTLQFVDSIASSPTVRLDLNDGTLWGLDLDGTDFSPPDLRRAYAGTMLRDGSRIPAAAYGNRPLTLRLDLKAATVDAAATQLQLLHRELDRPANIVRWQPGTTAPVFFRTFRSPVNRITEYPGTGTFKTLDVVVEAEPFALGLAEVLSGVLIANDPADRFADNANPGFETGTSPWTLASAGTGTLVQDGTQFYSGSFSGKFTPDGVATSPQVRTDITAATAGVSYRATAWVRCAVSRNVDILMIFRDGGGTILTVPTATTAVTANVWTPLSVTATAPASTATKQLAVNMGSTPPAGHILFIDEARIRQNAGAAGGMFWDITGVKGDVETPPVITLSSPVFTADRQALLAVRRSPTSTDLPLLAEAESATLGTDTSAQPGDATMPTGFSRTTFATTQTMATRLTTAFGTVASTVLRGRYRVLARCRKSVGADVVRAQLTWAQATNTAVTLPANTETRWIDLGTITVPAYNDPVTDPAGVALAAKPVTVTLAAARDSGSGNLDVDRLIFIPAAGPLTSPGDDRLAFITIPPANSQQGNKTIIDAVSECAYTADASGMLNARPMPVAGLYPLLDPGSNRLYLMANAGLIGPADSLNDTVTVDVTYWPRYLQVRPPTT